MKQTNEGLPTAAGYLQFDVRTGDVAANQAAVDRGLAGIRGPGLVVLPELWATGFAYDRLAQLAAMTPEILVWLQERARQQGVIIAGSLAEAAGGGHHNTLFVVGAHGVLGQYRKQQLFAPMGEDRFFIAGEAPRPIGCPWGPLAALVCYDLRFPELATHQTALGATIIAVSAQWPKVRLEHWRTLVRARAMENQAVVVAANRCGKSGDTVFAGHSLVVGPDGTVLAEAEEAEATTMVPLAAAMVEAVRKPFCTVGRTPYRFPDATKVVDWPAAEAFVAANRGLGRVTVFTNGCFDILHSGHVTYLEAARRLGDCLMVGLNSDDSIRRLKGEGRPVNPVAHRARVLAALGCVDRVVVFEEDTPLELIRRLQPDVLVKGGDWPVEKIVGGDVVRAAGGKVVTIPLVAGCSTTGVIQRIREER